MEMDTHMGHHDTHAQHAAQVEALFAPGEATHVAVSNGDWSNASTWNTGQVPGEGALVLIPEGRKVVYDANSSVELEMVRVDGTLSWSRDQDTSMHVETILSSHGSHLEIGTMEDPIPANVSAEITFTDGPIDLKTDPGQLGHGLVTFGEVNINGAEKADHLTMNGGANAGATSIVVEGAATGWEPGDQILLVGTEFLGEGPDGALQTQDETRTIVSVDGNKVTFDKPLQYDHQPPAGHDFDTYVANLSRNVVLQSENPEGVRGHFMMHNGMTEAGDKYANTVVNAEFRDMGRTDQSKVVGTEPGDDNPQGRYSIHLHEIGTEPGAATSLIQGNAVSGNPGWGIVQHSSNALINENVVYDVTGAGIVSEMGGEIGAWNNNLVSSVTGPGVHKQVGSEGAAYENQSRVITQENNIAANSKIAWNYSGRESFVEDEVHDGAPKDGIHRKMFERDQLQYDPSPFDVAIDHEEPAITGFNGNTSVASEVGFRAFHRQFSDDTDTMSVITDFTVWGGLTGIELKNYASNYQFMDSTVQGERLGFWIERKTSSAVLNNVEFHDFDTGYRSVGLNHEVVLIDTEFKNIDDEFDLKDLMANVTSDSLRRELIDFYRTEHGIDYENPMPQIVDSRNLTQVNAVTFTPNADADLTIGPNDSRLNIVGTITDSVGVRRFNEYVEAKTPKGTGTSKDFEGVEVNFAGQPSDEPFKQKEFTRDEFLEEHGTYQKADGSWVSPVVNWITDRLTGDQHPVVIEIKLEGYDEATMKSYELAEYPNPGINNPNFDSGIDAGHSGGGHDGHTGGGHDGHTGGGDDGHTGGGDDGHTGGGDDGHTGGGDDGHTGGGDDGHAGGGDGGHAGGGDGGHTGGGDGGHTGGGDGGHTGNSGDDSFKGTNGNDVLASDGGNDTIAGGEGDDTLRGQDGEDALWGGNGSDDIDGLSGDDKIGGADGTDKVNGGAGNDTLWGGNDNDTLNGGNGTDFLGGGNGNDQAFGGAGDDNIAGGRGNDTIWGGSGDDEIFGSIGNDVVEAGDGNDSVYLGAGNDIIAFSAGNDLVYDYDANGNDRVHLAYAEGITSFADLKANHLGMVDGNAVITDAAGNTLTLEGVDANDLSSYDFMFL